MPKTPKAIVGIVTSAAVLLFVAGPAMGAEIDTEPLSPEAFGFRHFYKCPNDGDVLRIGDTITPQACLKACENQARAAGCWWLDGTGGFPRQCRVCKTLTPWKKHWPNDWATPMEADAVISLLGENATERPATHVAAVCNSAVCNSAVCNSAVCNSAVCNSAVCNSNANGGGRVAVRH